MRIAPGDRIGVFVVGDRLGAGGMGEVYLARDTALGRDVALKVVLADGAHAGRLARLRREARVLAALNHPGIAAIYGLEEHEGAPILVLELVQGPTLAERLKDGPLPVPEALRVARDVADALAFAHQKGVVHRDLKPANVKIGADGRAKMLDFGLARLADAPDPSRGVDEATAELTAEGAVFGTAPYMSPEQARGGAVDRATDVWAFGAVLFEMLTGRRAFPTVASIFESDPDWSLLPPSTPAAVRHLLRRALQKDPARRLSHLADAAAALDASAAGPSRGTGPFVAIAAVALLVAVAAGLWSLQSRLATSPAALTAGAAVPPPALRRSVVTLGLTNLSARDDLAWISTAMREVISAELWSGGALRIVSGEAVARMQSDLLLPASEAFSPDTLARIREHLGADAVIAGAFVPAGAGRVRVDARVQDTVTGETLAVASEVGAVADLAAIGQAIGGRLRAAFGLSAPAAPETLASSALPAGEAGVLYAEGLARQRAFDLAGARQRFEAAIARDPSAALAHSARAEVLSALGFDVAAREAAAEAFARAGTLDPRQRARIEGQHRIAAGEWARAIEIHTALLAGEPDDLEIGLRLVTAERRGGRPDEARQTLARLRQLPPPLGDDPRLDLTEAQIDIDGADPKSALERVRRAAATATARGLRTVLASARLAECRTQIMLGQYDAAIEAGRESQRHFEAAGDRAGVADALGTMAIAFYYRADYDAQRRLHEQQLAIARAIGARRQESVALANLGMIDSLTGALEQARAREEEALAIRRELADRAGMVNSLHNLGELGQSVGDLPSAVQRYQDALALAREVGARSTELFIMNGLGDVAAARGEFDAALDWYTQALTARDEAGERAQAATSRLAVATALLAAGRPVDARPYAEQAAVAFREVKDPAREGWALGFLAVARALTGDLAGAREALDAGRPLVERATYVRARVTFGMNEARVLTRVGAPADLARARRAAEAALEEARRTGYVNRQMEIALALGEAELADPSTRAAGQTRLGALARDARTRGYLVLATAADALLAAGR